MQVVIEFYRTRNKDDAHAVVGRETREAIDLAGAIETAQLLAKTLDMPQRPDAMTIADVNGNKLHIGSLDVDPVSK